MPIRNLIVLANVQWPKFGAVAGGAVHAFEVASRLSRRCKVLVIAPDFVAQEVHAAFPELRLIATPSLRWLTSATLPVLAFSCVSWLRRIKAIRGADTILCASHLLGDVLPLLFTSRTPAAVVVHHIVQPPQGRPGSFVSNLIHYSAERLSLSIASARAGAFITSSHLVADELRGLGIRQPIVVTTNATRPFQSLPPAAAERPPDRVVFVGHVAPPKGLESLIEAWPAVVRRHPSARLRILGSGDSTYVAELKRQAVVFGVGENIDFLGRVDNETKERELFSASVFAFPSVEEGFGIALVEAMAARVPCVTYDLPIFREIFLNGRVAVPLGDMARFADAVSALLDDDVLRLNLADAAHEESGRFTWERAAELDWQALELARP